MCAWAGPSRGGLAFSGFLLVASKYNQCQAEVRGRTFPGFFHFTTTSSTQYTYDSPNSGEVLVHRWQHAVVARVVPVRKKNADGIAVAQLFEIKEIE